LLELNLILMEILDGARQSAKTRKRVDLPLKAGGTRRNHGGSDYKLVQTQCNGIAEEVSSALKSVGLAVTTATNRSGNCDRAVSWAA